MRAPIATEFFGAPKQRAHIETRLISGRSVVIASTPPLRGARFWTRDHARSTSPGMSAMKTYSGGCHCGAVRYEVKLDLSQPVVSCNCSMCGRSGTLLSFVPESEFSLKSGEAELTNYLFNRHAIQHLFCSVCGIKPFARGKSPEGGNTVAVNVRCLDDVDLKALVIHEYDGKSS